MSTQIQNDLTQQKERHLFERKLFGLYKDLEEAEDEVYACEEQRQEIEDEIEQLIEDTKQLGDWADSSAISVREWVAES